MSPTTQRYALALLVPAACAVTFARCDNFLETEPFGTLNTGTFYKTTKDFEAGRVGAYSTLQGLTWSGGDQSL